MELIFMITFLWLFLYGISLFSLNGMYDYLMSCVLYDWFDAVPYVPLESCMHSTIIALVAIYIDAIKWFIAIRTYYNMFLFRLILLSGKSALTIQLIQNHFVDEYDPTVRISTNLLRNQYYFYKYLIGIVVLIYFWIFPFTGITQIEDSYRKQVVIGE